MGLSFKEKCCVSQNLKDPTGIIAGELTSLPHYQCAPFGLPSVPETGDYQLPWCLDGEFYAAAFDSEGISKCFVPFADPQTCFHNSRAKC